MITYRTPLIQIPRPRMAVDVRRAMVANAMSLVGVEAGNPETRKIFEAILGPVPGGGKWDLDRPFKMWKENGAWKTQGVSTCAMVALGILSRLWPAAPAIMDGYDIGKGLDVGIAFAARCGGWQPPVAYSGLLPGAGAIVQVDGPMHVEVIVGRGEGTLLAVAGGQVCLKDGLQAIYMVERKVTLRKGIPHLGGRKIRGWIEVDLLSYEDELVTAPRGWEMVEVVV